MGFEGTNALAPLRRLEAMVQGLELTNPLRILLLWEPDEIPRTEYATKVVGWFRLIETPERSARLDGR